MPKICIVCATMFDQTSNVQKCCSKKCKKIRTKKIQERYNQSEKGKATNKRNKKLYKQSKKGKASQARYLKKYRNLYSRTERGKFLINENRKKVRRKQQLAYAVVKSLGIPLNVEESNSRKKYKERTVLSYKAVQSMEIQL